MTERPTPTCSWSAHPAHERPRQALAALLTILLFSAEAALFGEHAGWGVVSALTLVLVLNRFFFPSHFSIDAGGLTARYPLATRRLLWTEQPSFEHGSRGGCLSVQRGAGQRPGTRSIHVLFGRESDVPVRIRRALAQAAGSSTPGPGLAAHEVVACGG